MSSHPQDSSTQGPALEVIVARSAGICFGVRSAIEVASRERQPILGPLVHNPKVVDDLARAGIPILERYEELDLLAARGVRQVVITPHGYPRELKEQLRSRGIGYHDATCPVLLDGVYGKIRRFEESGRSIILMGDPAHAEVIASRSYGRRVHVVHSETDADRLPRDLGRVVAICQTTITLEKFSRLVEYIRANGYPGLESVDTRCKPVKDQQEGVEELARSVDAMLVVGGLDSSNSRSLARIAGRHLPGRTYHVDDADRIDPGWLVGVRRLGIGAGTSTPRSQLQAVMDHIRRLHGGVMTFGNGLASSSGSSDVEVSTEH
ncbi:MAG: 4-hydroxy-3-methylbut-2-enyl diphosphate reductase [Candidatus Riflebacteria bacterium]|nr:4-hydroxy-3-methylbut-2-enyl diphosphate reductase [Candidatus Riflebacteria bacterium]